MTIINLNGRSEVTSRLRLPVEYAAQEDTSEDVQSEVVLSPDAYDDSKLRVGVT